MAGGRQEEGKANYSGLQGAEVLGQGQYRFTSGSCGYCQDLTVYVWHGG